jgi:hypothetical protein
MALDFNQLVNQMSPDEVNRQLLQGQQPTNPTLSNFIPKLFEVRQPMYEGLLGAEQSNALARQSNIAGLLGAAATLAVGMGRQGARRSPIQNILGALAAGYGTAGQAYGAGIEQMANAQKFAQARLEAERSAQKQQAFAELLKMPEFANDPAMKTWALTNPEKALEMFVKRRGMQKFLEREGQINQPQALAVSPEIAAYNEQMAPYTASAGANVVPMAEPMREPTGQLAAGTVETAPVPDISGAYGALPTQPKPQPVTKAPAAHPLDAQIRQADLLAKYYQGEGNDPVQAKEYQAISKNLSDRKKQDVIASNVSKSLGSLNPMLQPLADALIANAGEMSATDIQSSIMDIRKKNAEFKVNTEKELRNEFNGLPEIKEFSTVETAFKQINAALSNPSAANDLAAATKFMKLLDPGSVVRESELGMAMAATGAIDRMQNYFQRLQNGQILNPAQRADFKRSAEMAFNAARETRNQTAGRYTDLATSYNVDPKNVVLGGVRKRDQEPVKTPQRNTKGWQLSQDAQGNRAYVSPDGTQFEEVK